MKREAPRFENYDRGFNEQPSAEEFGVIEEFANNAELKHLYICGGTGVGKTHLAKAIVNQNGKHEDNYGDYLWCYKFLEFHEFYYLMQDWVNQWKNIRPELLPKWGYKTIKKGPGVIIDDLGSEPEKDQDATEYGLRDLILANNLKIIITSNLSEDSFLERYEKKIHSLFFDTRISCKIEFPGGSKDYRLRSTK